MWCDVNLDELEKERWLPPEPRSRQEIERIVVCVRLDLYNQDLPCGSAAIRKNMDEYWHVNPLPSTSAISRILARNCLTHGRTGYYEGEDPDWTPASSKPLYY